MAGQEGASNPGHSDGGIFGKLMHTVIDNVGPKLQAAIAHVEKPSADVTGKRDLRRLECARRYSVLLHILKVGAGRAACEVVVSPVTQRVSCSLLKLSSMLWLKERKFAPDKQQHFLFQATVNPHNCAHTFVNYIPPPQALMQLKQLPSFSCQNV